MKVLVTGAKGQMGRALNRLLKNKEGYQLVLTDLDEMDITDEKDVERVMNAEKPDVVINCAAHTKVDLCEDDKENAEMINVRGPKNLAQVSAKIGAKMVHLSTDYIFDGEATTPYVEESTPNPQSVYGVTKLKSEQVVMQNNPKHFIVRTAWLYGEGNNFVNTMLRLADHHKEIKVVDDQLGNPTSAMEVARVIEKLIETEDYGIYNATCEGECTWFEFAKRIFDIAQRDVTVSPCTSMQYVTRAKRPQYSVLDNKNLREKFGYTMKHWEEALKEHFNQ